MNRLLKDKKQLNTTSAPIALILDTRSPASGGLNTVAEYCHRSIERALQLTGLPFATLSDYEVNHGKLASAPLAILPYNTHMIEYVKIELRKYIERGGKLMIFFEPSFQIIELLDIKKERTEMRKWPDSFNGILFKGAGGLFPKEIQQRAFNINLFSFPPRTKIAAVWKNTNFPALALTPKGAIFTIASGPTYNINRDYVLLAHDTAGYAKMLTGIVGYYAPHLFKPAAPRAAALINRIGHYHSLKTLESAVEKNKADDKLSHRARQYLSKARQTFKEGRQYLAKRQFQAAHTKFITARENACEAYYATVPSPKKEIRAIWRSWDPAILTLTKEELYKLKDSGFNMVLLGCVPGPFILNKVNAATRIKWEKPLRQYLAWAKEYGIDVHLWTTPWMTWPADEAVLSQMQKQGRLVVDNNGKNYFTTREGKEGYSSLCPANRDTQRLIISAMKESILELGLTGYHLDLIRYNSDSFCFCQNCRDSFGQDTGLKLKHWPADVFYGGLYHKAFVAWRYEQINRFMRDANKAMKEAKPGCLLSTAVWFGNVISNDEIAQNPTAWAKEGSVDAIFVMNYTESQSDLAKLVKRQVKEIDKRALLASGLGPFVYFFQMGSPEELVAQIQISRNAGADGVIMLHHDLDVLMSSFCPVLKRSVFRNPATFPIRR